MIVEVSEEGEVFGPSRSALVTGLVLRRAAGWVDNFLGVGGGGAGLASPVTNASCPKGTVAMGYSVAPTCYGVNLLQVSHRLFRVLLISRADCLTLFCTTLHLRDEVSQQERLPDLPRRHI